MVRFATHKANTREFLAELAKLLNVSYEGGRLEFPHEVADGYFQVFTLPTGLDVVFGEFSCNSNLILERNKTDEEYYMLRFDHVKSGNFMVTTIEGEEFHEQNQERASAFLICSLMDIGYAIGKGTRVQMLSIIFPRELLGKYLRLETYDKIFQHYLALKTKTLLLEPLDAEYRRILNELFQLDKDHPAYSTIASNRIMDLVERFFSNLYEKRKQLKYRVDFSNEDIMKIRNVEKMITEDVRKPCPKIEDLAKTVFISPSKLKKLFKNMYGVPVYQYYLTQKMQVARTMLLSGRYSIKEVGMELGYNNLSNFSAAFKKEFGMLPSNMIQDQKIGISVLV